MCNQSDIKALTRHLVERVGGPKIAAKICAVSETEISLWGNANNKRFIPIDHLIDLDAWASDLFLKDWASKRGYDLVSRDEKPSAADNVFKTIGQLAKAGGALECTALEAASDHKITPNEERAIRDHIRPVKDSIEQLERVIAQ